MANTDRGGTPTPGTSRDEFIAQALNPAVCFLCGIGVDDKTRSREHVFPRWLLHRHGLWDARLTLLNGETIPYRQLTITCCTTCNNEYLSRLEDEVGAAFAGGPESVRALPEERLFLWLAKFYYGLVFRELTLRLDVRDPDQGMIVDEELLRQYSLHHLLLRRLLGIVDWNEFPASMFVFDALHSEDRALSFDYFDALDGPFVCVRSGPTFVVGFLQDFGAVHGLGIEDGPRLAAARRLRLHPMQCVELMALFYTVLKSRERVPKFVIGKHEDRFQVMVMPQGGLSGRSPFKPFDEDLFFAVLARFFAVRFDIDIGVTEQHRPTLLISSRGDPIQAPSADWMPQVWDAPRCQTRMLFRPDGSRMEAAVPSRYPDLPKD